LLAELAEVEVAELAELAELVGMADQAELALRHGANACSGRFLKRRRSAIV
jgi:hypothetical protein